MAMDCLMDMLDSRERDISANAADAILGFLL